MREDEEFAKNAFDQFLSDKEVKSRNWRDGEDPPDYYLSINGKEFAVEVTNMMLGFQTSTGLKTTAYYMGSSKDFVKRVEDNALATGVLRGEYWVFFSERRNRFGISDEKLEEHLLIALQDTQSNEDLPLTAIRVDGRTCCSIFKTSMKENALRWAGFSLPMYSVNSVTRMSCNRLKDSVNKKYEKLKKLDCQKILLLLNDFVMVDSQVHKEFIRNIIHLKDFHTVFIIGRENYILYSKNADRVD